MWKVIRRLNNQKGVVMVFGNVVDILLTMLAFAVVMTLIFNTLIPSNIEQRAFNKYQADKTLFFSYIDDAFQSADSVSIATDEKEKGEHSSNPYSMLTATNNYKNQEGEFIETFSFDDKNDKVNYVYTKQKIKGPELEMITSSSVVFDTLQHLYVKEINKVCTDDSLAKGCYNVNKLVDIMVYGEKTRDEELIENRSRRLVHYD